MSPAFFPYVFTIEIDGRPTVTFEAKTLREANEFCNAPWLRDDFVLAHSNGAPLWNGKAELRARIAYEEEIATFGDVTKDGEAADGLALVYLVELHDGETGENTEPGAFPLQDVKEL